jgi:hypothetical protein
MEFINEGTSFLWLVSSCPGGEGGWERWEEGWGVGEKKTLKLNEILIEKTIQKSGYSVIGDDLQSWIPERKFWKNVTALPLALSTSIYFYPTTILCNENILLSCRLLWKMNVISFVLI